MKYLVKLDLEFDLKFEISDGKNLVKFGSETSFQSSRHFSETSVGRRAVLIV